MPEREIKIQTLTDELDNYDIAPTTLISAVFDSEGNGLDAILDNKQDKDNTYDKETINNKLLGKQNKLVAGENITIDGNVISASGGSGPVDVPVEDVEVDGSSVVTNKVAKINLTGKQDKTDNTLTTTTKQVVGAINELNTNKVNKTTTIAGIDLQDNITANELDTALKDVTTTFTNKTIDPEDNNIGIFIDVATLPTTGIKDVLYHNTTDDKLYFYKNGEWKAVGSGSVEMEVEDHNLIIDIGE